jgi:hypothetical protein
MNYLICRYVPYGIVCRAHIRPLWPPWSIGKSLFSCFQGLRSSISTVFRSFLMRSWYAHIKILPLSILCMIAGSVIVTVARNVAYLKAGRFFLGMSTALLEVSAPMYVVEMSPPQVSIFFRRGLSLSIVYTLQWRGRLTGM